MLRVDFHIIRTARGWHLQNARGTSLGVFQNASDAFEAGNSKAKEIQRRGLNARLTIHNPGKRADVFDFAAQIPANAD